MSFVIEEWHFSDFLKYSPWWYTLVFPYLANSLLIFRNNRNIPLWNFRINWKSHPGCLRTSWTTEEVRRPCMLSGLFLSDKEDFIYFRNRTWDLGNYFCVKNDREKQSSKRKCPRADGMSPVQRARCPSADSSFISSRACYICSKVPKTRQTDSSSVALLGLLETVAGNQLAVRIFKLFVTVWTNTLKRRSAHRRCSTSASPPRGCGCFKRGVRDNVKQGQFGQIVREVAPSHGWSHYIWSVPQRKDLLGGSSTLTQLQGATLPPQNLTGFKVLPWCENPFWTLGERVFWVDPVSKVPFPGSKLISNIKAEKHQNSRGNRR